MAVLGPWSQTVDIGSTKDASVSGLSIREQSRAPITDIQFEVEDSPATRNSYDAVVIDEDVRIKQSNGNNTRVWNARVVRFGWERGTNWTKKRVDCETLETITKRRRIFGVYEGDVKSVVEAIWNEWGTFIVSGTNVDNLTNDVSISLKWDSLFDAIDEVARRFDYAWNIDADNDELRFFDPAGLTSPAIVQGSGDIIGKTATIKRNGEDIVNTVIATGWIYRTVTKSITMPTGFGVFSATDIGCRKGIHLRQIERMINQGGWEVADTSIPNDFAVQDIAEDREVEVWDDGWIVFDPPLIPGIQAPNSQTGQGQRVDFKVAVTLRRQGQTLVKNEASISQFGRRDGEPITDDGGQTLEEARQRAEIVVNARAWPTIEADMDLTKIGPQVDTKQRLTMTDPPIDRDFFVESVDHATRGNELTVSVSLSTEDPA